MMKRQDLLVLSPFFILGMDQVSIRYLARLFGVWSWAPFWFIYVLMLGIFVSMSGGPDQIVKRLAPSKNHWIWRVLACVIPVGMTLPIFLLNWRLLISPHILLWTLLFVAINPLLEELYWRGTLLDATRMWPGWLSVFFSTLGFALHHLWIGVIAAAGRHPFALVGPILMGGVWAITYKSTRSLRWPILGHFLANVFSLSVPVFLNLYFPPGIPGG
jgi:membrane protease YdiL (CAAX protease family)